MLLHEMMDAAVADVSADLHSLAAASSRQGLAIRRRRRALATVGASAAAVVLSVAGWIAWPGGSDTVVATDTTRAIDGPLSGDTAPITGGGVAAAFVDAVGDVTDGTMTQFQGDATRYGGEADASAELLLVPTTGSGPAGRVMVNLQPLKYGGATPYTCDTTFMTQCAVRTLANGDALRTYHEDGDTEFGGAESQRAVAELLSPTRHLRVVVFAMNTNSRDKGDFRDQTVLDLDQLTEIATQPWWSRTQLPIEYVAAGQKFGITPSR